MSSRTFQFKVSLKGSKFPFSVSRRLQLLSTSTFGQLHSAILTSLNWVGHHHRFEANNDFTSWTIQPPSDHRSQLASLFDPYHTGAGYEMDLLSEHFPSSVSKSPVFYWFNSWKLEVVLEKVLLTNVVKMMEPQARFPRCIGGEGASPPQDGNPSTYRALLRIVTNPSHQDHAKITEWMRDNDYSLAPTHFDLKSITFEYPEE